MNFIDKPVTTPDLFFTMDMATCPTGRKVIALNPGKVACFAVITNTNRADFIGWCPLPKVPKPEIPLNHGQGFGGCTNVLHSGPGGYIGNQIFVQRIEFVPHYPGEYTKDRDGGVPYNTSDYVLSQRGR